MNAWPDSHPPGIMKARGRWGLPQLWAEERGEQGAGGEQVSHCNLAGHRCLSSYSYGPNGHPEVVEARAKGAACQAEGILVGGADGGGGRSY